MIRRSMALFTVVVAFAAAAPAAVAAPQFMGFIEEPPPSTHLEAALAGEQTATTTFAPTPGAPPVSCPDFGLAGRLKNGKGQTISIRPEPKLCSTAAPKSVTDVRMNGCAYRFTVTSKIAVDKYQGTMGIVCPAGRQIELVDTRESIETQCRRTIPAQEGIGPVYFEDMTAATPDHIGLELKVSGIKSTTAGGEILCGVKDGEHSEGMLNGAFTLKAYSTVAQVDFLVTGEAEPQFTSFGVAPVLGPHVKTLLQGKSGGTIEFRPTAAFAPIYCTEAIASGELASGTGTQATLPLEYSKCTSEFLPPLSLTVEAKSNGCDQRFRVEKQVGEDEYTGKMDILCPVGKQIELQRAYCVTRIPAQEGLGPVLYRVRKDVAPHDLLVEPQITTLKTENAGVVCPSIGTFTTGRYFAELTLRGLSASFEPLNLSFGGKEPSFEFTGAPASLPPSIFPKATTVKGAQATTHQYVPAAGFSPVKCGTASLQGALATGVGTSLSAKPTYSSCATASALTTNVRLNGCEYKLRPTKLVSVDKYQGVTDVLCSGGEEIEFEVTNPGGTFRCLDTIPPQEGAGPVYFEDQTAATPDDVIVNFQITNLRNQTSGGLANCGVANGEHTGGAYTGTSTARGYDAGEKQIEFQVNG